MKLSFPTFTALSGTVFQPVSRRPARVALLCLATLFGGCMATAATTPPAPVVAAAPAAPATPAAPAAPAAPASLPAGVIESSDVQARWIAVLDEVGPASCTAASQCRSVAVGHKACGGPERYLAWSTASSDATRLGQRVEAYNAARQSEVQKSGQISNCMMMMDPGAVCEAGRCVSPAQGRSPVVR